MLADLVLRVSSAHSEGADAGAASSQHDDQTSDIERWLASITDLRPWQQLLLIEDAAAVTDQASPAAAILEKARTNLLNDNPAVNVRIAVQRAALEHPWQLAAGCVGLVLAAVAVAKGAFRLVF